jgi:hypothetical protein
MIIRRCSQGHRVRLHRNTTPNAVRQKTYADGTVETLTYPSSGYDYFVEVDGTVVKRSDNFNTIETYFVSKCADKHDDGHGRVLIGKHKLVNGVATLFSEIPTSSNTVAEIKTFLSARGISYKNSDSKTTLLETVDTLKPNPGG